MGWGGGVGGIPSGIYLEELKPCDLESIFEGGKVMWCSFSK